MVDFLRASFFWRNMLGQFVVRISELVILDFWLTERHINMILSFRNEWNVIRFGYGHHRWAYHKILFPTHLQYRPGWFPSHTRRCNLCCHLWGSLGVESEIHWTLINCTTAFDSTHKYSVVSSIELNVDPYQKVHYLQLALWLMLLSSLS